MRAQLRRTVNWLIGMCVLTCLVTVVLAAYSHAAEPSGASISDVDSPNQSEISRYEAIVGREPGNADALAKLADLLYSNHRSGEAVPLWRKALSLNPALVEPRWSLGVVYWERGDLDAAKSAYLEVLARDPGHVNSRINLAALYRQKGQLRDAETEYRSILKMRPDAGSLVHHGLGQILAGEKRWSEAIEEYRTELHGGDGRSALGTALVRMDLAEALRKTGKFAEAEEEVGQALGFLTSREHVLGAAQWRPPAGIAATANFELARIHAAQKRIPESLKALDAAVGYDPSVLEKMESSEDLETVRVTEEYRNLASSVRAQRQSVLEARFTGKIQWIEVIGKREANVAFSEADARWLIGVEISGVQKSSALFDKPGQVILAIHSPVKLLARSADSALGKSYAFQAGGEMREGKAVYRWVLARELGVD